MDSKKTDPVLKISVKRDGQILDEYPPQEIGSLYETGHLKEKDLCLDPESGEWIPLRDFLRNARPSRGRGRRRGRARRGLRLNLLLFFFVFAVILGVVAWESKTSAEIDGLKASLAKTAAENLEWKQKFENVLFAAREVASNDLVRGRVIIRDANGQRVVLPGIKIRLYPRAEIEEFLSERYKRIADAGGTDANRLSAHFLKTIPLPIETTTTDSDGRFECKIPQPGEYVIQTGIRSGKTGGLRLWFVAFDSRDPLNTPVDITETNAVQQFNPLFMLVDGR